MCLENLKIFQNNIEYKQKIKQGTIMAQKFQFTSH